MVFTDEQNAKKVLDFALTEHVSPANAVTAVYIAIVGLDDLSMFYSWLDKNFDALSKKMPAYHLARMPEYFASSCDAGNVKLAEKFFTDKKANFDGMARSFDIAMNSANQCLSLKEANQADFTRYLEQATKS
jgi:alanyl aminopeptidase